MTSPFRPTNVSTGTGRIIKFHLTRSEALRLQRTVVEENANLAAAREVEINRLLRLLRSRTRLSGATRRSVAQLYGNHRRRTELARGDEQALREARLDALDAGYDDLLPLHDPGAVRFGGALADF